MKATEKRNEIIAMNIICNIQQMQKIVNGKSFEYNNFNGNTIDELYEIQNMMIQEYNNKLKK